MWTSVCGSCHWDVDHLPGDHFLQGVGYNKWLISRFLFLQKQRLSRGKDNQMTSSIPSKKTGHCQFRISLFHEHSQNHSTLGISVIHALLCHSFVTWHRFCTFSSWTDCLIQPVTRSVEYPNLDLRRKWFQVNSDGRNTGGCGLVASWKSESSTEPD